MHINSRIKFRKESKNSIGIFDSGLGGLTVMREVIKILPHENIIYFGDTAHLPYGEKSKQFIIERSHAISAFMHQKSAKLIVVACHTASTNAMEVFDQHCAVPNLLITPSTIEAVVKAQKKRIAILATSATIESGIYQKLLKQRLPDAEIFPVACPRFVPLIEQDQNPNPMIPLIVHETVKELKSKQIEIALLGSTHFPFIQDIIQKELGDNVLLIDPARMLAENVRKFLSLNHLLHEGDAPAQYQFHASKDPEKFQLAAEKFLQISSVPK